MKKICIVLLSMVFGITLCSCGSTPIDHSIAAMNYQLLDSYVEETDQETAIANYDDTISANDDLDVEMPSLEVQDLEDVIGDSDGESSDTSEDNDSDNEDTEEDETLTGEDYLDLHWYDGSYSVVVTAQRAFYNNNEFDDAVKDIYGDEGGDYKKIKSDSFAGRKGAYTVRGSNNYGIDILKDGILYSFTFYNAEDISEEEVNAVIDSISFDNGLLKKHKVECGDYKLTLPGTYSPLTTDDYDKDEYRDMKAYGRCGDARVDFSINYFDADDYVSVSELSDYMKSTLSSADYSEIKESFGKCYYMAGKYEGEYEVLAFFEENDKLYMLDMVSEDAKLSIEDMQKITKTIEKK